MPKRLQDVTLQIRHLGTDDDAFEAVLSSDQYGSRSGGETIRFNMPSDSIGPMLAELEKKLDQFGGEPTGKVDRLAPMLAFQQRFGQKLFDAVLHGENREHFHRLLGGIDTQPSSGLRLRIAWEADDAKVLPLIALPWELINDESADGFLSQRMRFPMSRFLEGLIPVAYTESSSPMRVLLVDSQPRGERLGPVLSRAEKDHIRSALDGLEEVEVFEEKADLETIRDRIRKDNITVLHFIGHGGFDDDKGRAHLTFVDADGGPRRHVAEDVAGEIKDLDTLKLVVLSTCQGATLPRKAHHNAFDAMAPALMRAGVGAVVAMQYPISHAGATEFSRRFYCCLALGDPIDVAAGEARRTMSRSHQPDTVRAEWPLPVVYMRVRNGRLFVPQSASTTPTQPALPPLGDIHGKRSSDASLTVGIRSFATGHAEGLERRVDRFLDLDEYFEKRRPRIESDWNDLVRRDVLKFLAPMVPESRRLDLDIKAHVSIACTAGWAFPAKSGVRVRIAQTTPGADSTWFDARKGEIPGGALLNVEHIELDGQGPDVALACGVTHRVIQDVIAYATQSRPEIGRIIHAFPKGGPGHQAIHSGAHAFAMADALVQLARGRSIQERLEPLHAFFAMPNSLAFFFGQLAHGLGEIQFYEYPFGSKGSPGVYWPSITLPPD